MKKAFLTVFALLCVMRTGAQSIERMTDVEGGKVVITSQEKLFSGCQLRMCRYTDSEDVIYGLELDLTDRADFVREGSLFTIEFKDGSKLNLTNKWDTKADVKSEDRVETFHRTYTDIAYVYDAWDEAVYAVPVTGSYQEHVPVRQTTTRTSLYYVITPQQIRQIIDGDVKQVSIVTEGGTIVKKARPLSNAVAVLYEVVRK